MYVLFECNEKRSATLNAQTGQLGYRNCLNAMKSGVQLIVNDERCSRLHLIKFECNEKRSATSHDDFSSADVVGLNAMKSGVQRTFTHATYAGGISLNAMKSGVQPLLPFYFTSLQPV